DKIAQHGGRIVKTMDDVLLLEFPSVVEATQCMVEFQSSMAERNQSIDEDRRITFRIGVNLGDIIIEGEDILGDGVNIGARLQEIAQPGGVTISGRVYDDVRGPP
ncbi:MAG: adenylate/guanylate cyclase domain-containing protein, partial [Alphaproteobacteria bacterium]